MPQEFQVLQCYSCETFQVHQVKKLSKWNCKVCGEKQSIKKVYGLGSGADCRNHVQRLNTMRGEVAALKETSVLTDHCQVNLASEEDEQSTELCWEPKVVEPVRSKWSQYQEVGVEPVSDHEDTQYTTDKNYFKKQKQALKRKMKENTNPSKYSKLDDSRNMADISSHQFDVPYQKLLAVTDNSHTNFNRQVQHPDTCKELKQRTNTCSRYASESGSTTADDITKLNLCSDYPSSVYHNSSTLRSKWGRYVQCNTTSANQEFENAEFDETGNVYHKEIEDRNCGQYNVNSFDQSDRYNSSPCLEPYTYTDTLNRMVSTECKKSTTERCTDKNSKIVKEKLRHPKRTSNRQKDNSSSKWSKFMTEDENCNDNSVDVFFSDGDVNILEQITDIHPCKKFTDKNDSSFSECNDPLAGVVTVTDISVAENEDNPEVGYKKNYCKNSDSDLQRTMTNKTMLGYSCRSKGRDYKSFTENLSIFSAGELTEEDLDI